MATYVVLSIPMIGIAGVVFMLFRNRWVYRARMAILHADFAAYQTLPDYGVMMRRFWIWDAARFLHWREPQEVTEAIRRADAALVGRSIIARASTPDTGRK